MTRFSLIALGAAGAMLGLGPAQATTLDAGDLLRQFNLVTTGDVTGSSGFHVDGRALVGGDYKVQSGSVVYMNAKGEASGVRRPDRRGQRRVAGASEQWRHRSRRQRSVEREPERRRQHDHLLGDLGPPGLRDHPDRLRGQPRIAGTDPRCRDARGLRT